MGRVKIFRGNFFVSKCRQNLAGKPSVMCFRSFRKPKSLWMRWGGVEHQDSPSNFFYRTLPKKSRGEYLKVSLLSGIENFLDKRGGISRFSVEKFLSHIAKKFRRGTLLCCVAENFRKRKLLWLREEWEHQDYPSKLVFYLTVLKISRGRHP